MTKAEEHMHEVDSLDRGMVHISGRMEWEGMRLHRTTQNSTEFKMYESLISRIFHLTFLNFTAGN